MNRDIRPLGAIAFHSGEQADGKLVRLTQTADTAVIAPVIARGQEGERA